MPTKEKGARLFNCFIKHSGNKTSSVKPTNVLLRVKDSALTAGAAADSTVFKMVGMVSAKIMLYVTTVQAVTKRQAKAGIHDELGPTERAQA